MKKTILTIAIIISTASMLTSCATVKHLDAPDTKVKNTATTSDKNSNYIKANEWMVNSFNNAESVIQFTDKEAGVVKGKYVMKAGVVSTSPYIASRPANFAIITIRVKDQASRIEIEPGTGFYTLKSMGIETGFTPQMFNTEAEALIVSFEAHMQGKSENDNW